MTSKKWQLNKKDLWSATRGFLITLAGMALVLAGQMITEVDFGVWNAIAMPAAGMIIELGRRFAKDYTN